MANIKCYYEYEGKRCENPALLEEFEWWCSDEHRRLYKEAEAKRRMGLSRRAKKPLSIEEIQARMQEIIQELRAKKQEQLSLLKKGDL